MPLSQIADALGKIMPLETRRDLMLTFTVLFLITHIAWACGLLPTFGGFAHAADVQDIKRELLEQNLFTTRKAQCFAEDSASKQFYRERIGRLLREYYEVTKTHWEMPTCRELGAPNGRDDE